MIAKPSVLTLCLLCLPVAPALAGPAIPVLVPSLVRGGDVEAKPVAVGTRLYVPTGRVVSAWDFARPSRPARLGTSAPADGIINGLARHGIHLYASWRGHDATSGVAVFSLADPDAPTLVNDLRYTTSEWGEYATGVAVANDHLYVFDTDNGVFVSDLADPRAPAFTAAPAPTGSVVYGRIEVDGMRIRASGRGLGGDVVVDTYDVGIPLAPRLAATATLGDADLFGLVGDGDRAFAVGRAIATYDLSDPAAPLQQARVDIAGATGAAITGQRAWSFGVDGLDAWDIRDPDHPRHLWTRAVPTLGAVHAIEVGDARVLPTGTGLLQAFDRRVATPVLRSGSWLAAGGAPVDVAEHDGRIVLLHGSFGLTVNDARTLVPQARYEADLPQSLPARAFETLHVTGDVAWLASWGAGLYAVDLSGRQPVELGHLPVPLLSDVAVDGDHAWMITNTNERLLIPADVADPAAMVAHAPVTLPSQPFRIVVADGFAYIAERFDPSVDAGGLRVFDLAAPTNPVPVAHLDDGCGTAFDVQVDAAQQRAYLACEGGLQVVDVADPAAPRLLGSAPGTLTGVAFAAVAQRGTQAWYGDAAGLHAFDVSDPTRPVLVAMGGVGRRDIRRILPLADGRVATVGASGVHVFGDVARQAPAAAAQSDRATKAAKATTRRAGAPAR